MALRQKLELDYDQYKRDLRKAQRELRRFSRDAQDRADDTGTAFSRSAREADSAWSRAGGRIRSTLQSIGVVMASVFAVDLIQRFSRELVGVNDRFERINVTMTSLLGSAEAAETAIAKVARFSFDNAVPFEPFLQGLQQMIVFGVDAEKVLDEVNMQAVATAASLNPDGLAQGMQRVARALGQIQSKGRFSAEEANQLGEANVAVWELLEQQLGKSQKELRKLSEQGLIPAEKAINAILKGLNQRFPNLLAKQADTFSGMGAQLKFILQESLRDIGDGGFFDALKQSFRDALDFTTAAHESGRLQEIMRGVGRTLGELVRLTSDFVGKISSMGTGIAKMTALAAAFVAGRKAAAGLTMAVGGIQRGIEKIRGTTSFFGPKAIAKDRDELARVGHQINMIEGRLKKVRQQKTAMIQSQDFSGADKLRKQEAALTKELQTQQQAFDKLNRKGTTFGQRVGGSVKRLAKRFFTLKNVLSLVAMAFTAYIAFSDRVDKLTEKLDEQIEKVRELTQGLRRLSSAAAGMRIVDLELEQQLAQQDFEEMLDQLDPEIAIRLEGKSLKELEDIYDRLDSVDIMGTNVEGTLTDVTNFLARMGGSDDGNFAFGLQGPGRMGDPMRQQFLEEQGINVEEDDLQTLQQMVAAMIRYREAGEGLTEIQNESAENLKTMLEVLRARRDVLAELSVRTPAQDDRLAQLNRRIEGLEQRIAEAKRQGLDDDDPDPAPDPSPDTDEGLSERQLDRIREMVRRREELLHLDGMAADRMRERHGLLDEINRLQEQREQLRKAGDEDAAQDAQELIDVLRDRADAMEGEISRLQMWQQMYDGLSDDARTFIDDLGGMEEAFEDMELSPEQLEQMSGVVEHARSLVTEMQSELERIDVRLATDESYTEEQAEEDARVVADRFREKLQELLSAIPIENLPPQIGQMIQEVITQLSGMVGPANKGEKKVSQLGKALQDVARSGRTLSNLGSTLDVLGDKAEGFADGILDAVDNAGSLIERFESAEAEGFEGGFFDFLGDDVLSNLPGMIGVGAGIASSLASLLQDQGPDEDELAREMERLRDALNEAAGVFRSFAEGRLSEDVILGDLSRSEMEQAQETFRWMLKLDDANAIREALRELESLGVIDGSARDLFDELIDQGFATDTALAEMLNRTGLRDFMEQLGEQFAAFSDTLEGVLKEIDMMSRFAGLDPTGQLQLFLERLSSAEVDLGEGLEGILMDFLEGVDLSTEEGRERLQQLMDQLLEAFRNRGRLGDDDTYPNPFGSAFSDDLFDEVSPDDFEEIMDFLQGLLDGGGGGEGDDFTRNVQYLRTITEAQGAEVVILLKEISFWMRRLAQHVTGVPEDGLGGLPDDRDGDDRTPVDSLVPLGPVNVQTISDPIEAQTMSQGLMHAELNTSVDVRVDDADALARLVSEEVERQIQRHAHRLTR